MSHLIWLAWMANVRLHQGYLWSAGTSRIIVHSADWPTWCAKTLNAHPMHLWCYTCGPARVGEVGLLLLTKPITKALHQSPYGQCALDEQIIPPRISRFSVWIPKPFLASQNLRNTANQDNRKEARRTMIKIGLRESVSTFAESREKKILSTILKHPDPMFLVALQHLNCLRNKYLEIGI